MDSSQPNILFFDIETLPMLIFAWELGKQVVGYKNIYKERQVACIGYAWNDGPIQILELDYDNYDLHQRDNDADRMMIDRFVAVSREADLVVGHNLKSFDVSVLRSRIIKHQLPDFVPFLIDDTYRSLADVGFSSHKLDYMTGFLGLPPKEDHPYEMWLDVVTKVPGAFDKMKVYCMGDVDRTRQLYERVRPYLKSSLNRAVFVNDPKVCPNCGAKDTLIHRGFRYTLTGKYPRYECKSCHTFPSVGKSHVSKSGTFPR